MKKIFYIISLFILTQSCTDHYNELNTDPASFNLIDAGTQLAKVQVDLSGIREDAWRYDLGICSPLVQHLGGSWWTQHGGQYNVVDKNQWYDLWEQTYPRDLKNIQDLIERTSEDTALVNTNAGARIMRVYIYSRLTDLYGDIPYSEAGKGFTEQVFLPKYDKQEDIYANFFEELEEATKSFDASKAPVRGDLFFGGSVDKWTKFGNSLRLRLGFRLTKVNEAEAKKQVEAAIAAGVMAGNADIVMLRHEAVPFGNGENRGNGRSQVFQATPNSEGFRLTNTLVDFMKNTKDPRLTIYGGTYLENGTDITEYLQNGITYGAFWWNQWSDHGPLTDSNGQPVKGNDGNQIYVPQVIKHMQPSKYVSALNAPFFHMTYAEVELLLAEAAIRGWGGVADAETHFKNGIQASCEMMINYPGAPAIGQNRIDELKASYSPFPATFNDQMKVIHEQMWVNFFLNGGEAYSNYRRTGYPALVPFTSVEGINSGTNGVIPRRFFYPQSESIQNSSNYQDAVNRMGGNDWLKSVWWDKQ